MEPVRRLLANSLIARSLAAAILLLLALVLFGNKQAAPGMSALPFGPPGSTPRAGGGITSGVPLAEDPAAGLAQAAPTGHRRAHTPRPRAAAASTGSGKGGTQAASPPGQPQTDVHPQAG